MCFCDVSLASFVSISRRSFLMFVLSSSLHFVSRSFLLCHHTFSHSEGVASQLCRRCSHQRRPKVLPSSHPLLQALHTKKHERPSVNARQGMHGPVCISNKSEHHKYDDRGKITLFLCVLGRAHHRCRGDPLNNCKKQGNTRPSRMLSPSGFSCVRDTSKTISVVIGRTRPGSRPPPPWPPPAERPAVRLAPHCATPRLRPQGPPRRTLQQRNTGT